MTDPTSERRVSARLLALALLPMVVAVVLALLGPEDLDDNDQAKQALCMLDIWQRGNWILPLERSVVPATKPPLFAWLAVAASALCGGMTALTCKLPSALAAIATAGVTCWLGTERWGRRVGVAAAWMLGASPFVPVMTHVRPDAVMTLCVTLGLFALHRLEAARPRGTPWLFWSALSAAALAKGPVGPLLLLAPVAVLARRPERRAVWRPLLHPAMWTLALPLGWFLLAAIIGGETWLKGTVLNETVERALASGSRAGHGQLPGYLLLHFLAKFAPWSALALAGALVSLRREAEPGPRFPAVWFLTGLVLLNLARGQRWVYAMPLLPCAACLAAWLLETNARARLALRVAVGITAAASLGLGLALAGGLASAWPPAAAVTAGPGWVAALLLASALGAGAVVLDRRDRAPQAFALATAALLCLEAGYAAWLSPTARSERARPTAAFAADFLACRASGDRVVLYGDMLGNAVQFLMGVNEPALTPVQLASLDLPRDPSDARLLLVTTSVHEDAVFASFPGRFHIVARRGRGTRPDLVLLAAVGVRADHLQAPVRTDSHSE